MYHPCASLLHTNSSQDSHNILQLASPTAPRFQLLPLSSHPSPALPPAPSSLTATEPKKPPGARRTRDRSPVAQTASSFLSSMSQGWFGSTGT